MREVVTVQIGKAGLQSGVKFWETISEEHSIDPEGQCTGGDLERRRLDVFYNETSKGRQVPRCIMVDTESTVLDSIQTSEWGGLFLPDNIIKGKGGTGNSWAKGRHGEALQLKGAILDTLRKNLEMCDSPQCVQLCHSIGGGTGGGLAASIMDSLRQDRDRVKLAYTVLPSSECSDLVVEPYNVVLSVQSLENIPCVLFDNSALITMCHDILKLTTPTFGDLNHVIANVMSGVTSSLRFPGQLNYSIRKMLANLLPSNSLNFLAASIAPVMSRTSQIFKTPTVPEICQQLFNPGTATMVDRWTHNKEHVWLGAVAIFRGPVSMCEVCESLQAQASRLHWSPMICDSKKDYTPPIAPFACDVPGKGMEISGLALGNNTAVSTTLQRILDDSQKMWNRKAYVWWYTSDGLEEADFHDAMANVGTVIDSYGGYLADPNQEVEDDDEDE